MKVVWQTEACERPDPYLEWEYRTRPQRQLETWCSVQIEITPTGDDYLPSLYKLKCAANVGRQSDDGASPEFTIRMADDERGLLQERIDYLEQGGKLTDKVELQFFIYRWEPLIYDEGDYRHSAFYRIIFVGPPIVGLAFNDLNRIPDPLRFHPALTADRTAAIGIIDDGIAFAHRQFRSSSQKSRIQAVWLQETERRGSKDNTVLFGQRLAGARIDELLATHKSEADIYREVGLTDFGANLYNPLASRASHGTHVLDLAAGASDRPIFVVQLPSAATIDTSGVTMGSYVLQAVRMIMIWADRMGDAEKRAVPLVINFSYGLLAGPKDGTLQLEQALADLIDYRNNRARHPAPTRLVMPAGNGYRARAAARMELMAAKSSTLNWVVLPDDGATNYLEIWLDGGVGGQAASPVEVSLAPQDQIGAVAIRPEQGVMSQLSLDGSPVAGIYYQVFRHAAGTRERVLIAINPTVRNDQDRKLAPAGRWKLSVRNLTQQPITAHFYVQRDDTPFGYPRRGRQSYLDHADAYERDERTGDYRQQAPGCPITYQETLSSIATCSAVAPDHAIVVGAAKATDKHPPADYTSSGPTKARTGPDCSAFADEGDALWGVLAAGTFSGSVVAMSGTSVAAPQIARKIAAGLEASGPRASARDGNETRASRTPDGITIPVLSDDGPRLGQYIFRPAADQDIPKRRYPAVKELE